MEIFGVVSAFTYLCSAFGFMFACDAAKLPRPWTFTNQIIRFIFNINN